MPKLYLLILLCGFTVCALANDAGQVLEADEAFQFEAHVKNEGRLLLSWDISEGYYLYRDKIQFASLTPGIRTDEATFPPAQSKQDKFFGEVAIYRKHLDVELPVRKTAQTASLRLEVKFQGCADAGVCYLPVKKEIELDLSD